MSVRNAVAAAAGVAAVAVVATDCSFGCRMSGPTLGPMVEKSWLSAPG